MHISKYTISILFLLVSFVLFAQEETHTDSITKPTYYSVRVGLDISRPVIQLAQKEDLGFEITSDFRFSRSWYAALELGTESEPTAEDYITFHTKGSYAKIGANYNAYENWKGMNNEVFFGFRYGYSHFSTELQSYTIHTNGVYSDDLTVNPNTNYDNSSGHWGELQVGIKVEIINNLFLSSSFHFKKLISTTVLENFDTLYIPGFNTVMLNNNGIGFNYSVSYLIPLSL